MRSLHVVWAVALCGLAGCSHGAVTPTVARDAETRLASYRTYAWLPPPVQQQDEDVGAPAALQRAADRELQGKGYQRVDQGPVDFLVRPSFKQEEQTSVRSVDPSTNEYVWNPYFPPSIGGTGAPPPDLERWEEVTLGVDILDTRSGRVEWSASTRADLGVDPSEEEVQQSVEEAMSKVLEAFPKRVDQS